MLLLLNKITLAVCCFVGNGYLAILGKLSAIVADFHWYCISLRQMVHDKFQVGCSSQYPIPLAACWSTVSILRCCIPRSRFSIKVATWVVLSMLTGDKNGLAHRWRFCCAYYRPNLGKQCISLGRRHCKSTCTLISERRGEGSFGSVNLTCQQLLFISTAEVVFFSCFIIVLFWRRLGKFLAFRVFT